MPSMSFAKIRGAVALGSSKGRAHTTKGLVMIRSDAQRETQMSSSVSGCSRRDGRGQWHWKFEGNIRRSCKADPTHPS